MWSPIVQSLKKFDGEIKGRKMKCSECQDGLERIARVINIFSFNKIFQMYKKKIYWCEILKTHFDDGECRREVQDE